MLLKTCVILCLLSVASLIRSTCCLNSNIQNLEYDDVVSIWDKFPTIIDRIKDAVTRFRCPYGWKRLGGSCYYLSNQTSTLIDANSTCHDVHSNLSNLIRIRNGIELFYATYVLSRNSLSSLMIEIDSELLRNKVLIERFLNDDNLWKRAKGKLRDVRVKYQIFKKRIIDQLDSSGFRLSRRSKKRKSKFEYDKNIVVSQYDEYKFNNSNQLNTVTNLESTTTSVNTASLVDNEQYEYDDFAVTDEFDEFEYIENIHEVCGKIDWNVFDTTSTVYILTTYIVANRTVCSLSNVEPEVKYHHLCEYVLDFCFGNVVCGKHGSCVNTIEGFKCSCSFLFGGIFCDKISQNGWQIIISTIFIIILGLSSIKVVRCIFIFILKRIFTRIKSIQHGQNHLKVSGNANLEQKLYVSGPASSEVRHSTMTQEIVEFISKTNINELLPPKGHDLTRNIWVGLLSILFLIVLFACTTARYLLSFVNFANTDAFSQANQTIRLVIECEQISDYRMGNLVFSPFAIILLFIFSWSVKRQTYCKDKCEQRPGIIPPIQPFRTGNRFTTATVFGIIAFEVLKIFEELIFTLQALKYGVLIELAERIAVVILVGLRYYPVLSSLQLKNVVVRFFACVYIICDIIYTIVREGSCMGFVPLSGRYTVIEEAKLRRELGTWFIIYGLIKNIPHFFLLSYIGAELCVRFIYDSLFSRLKGKNSIWSAPIIDNDEAEFSKYYVKKLFQRNRSKTYINKTNETPNSIDETDPSDQTTPKHQEKSLSRLKDILNIIYSWSDDFRFTTMSLCTYTVAAVFLYYLSCTFVFLYLSRTTGHVSYMKHYLESVYSIDLGDFSLKWEVTLSAIITGSAFGYQLFLGMKNYKQNRMQLYKGLYIGVPQMRKFHRGTIASNAVHYSGFLVGYMAWGFVICFHLVLFILIAIKILTFRIYHVEIILAIVVPLLVIYFLKLLCMKSAGTFLFITRVDNKFILTSRHEYSILIYFSFFADCFLGVASCIIRLIQALCLNIFFMARLDWSFFGRPLEQYDLGFAAYVSYLYMEVACTHPVMLAFCHSLYDDIIKQRKNYDYDDECCITQSESDDENKGYTRNAVQAQDRDRKTAQGTFGTATNSKVHKISSKSSTKMPTTISKNRNMDRKMKNAQKSNLSDEEYQVMWPTTLNSTETAQTNISKAPEIPPRSDEPPPHQRCKNKAYIANAQDSSVKDSTSNNPRTTTISSINHGDDSKNGKIERKQPKGKSDFKNISSTVRMNTVGSLNNSANRSHSRLPKPNETNHGSDLEMQLIYKLFNNPIPEQQSEENNSDKTENNVKDDNISLSDSLPSTAYNNLKVDHSNESITSEIKRRYQRRRLVRFRWHLLYTLLRNYQLLDLRKDIQSRLARLHQQRSNLIVVQQCTYCMARTTDIPAKSSQKDDDTMPTTEHKPLPVPFRRLISVPLAISPKYQESAAERYIEIRAGMLYDANAQHSQIPNSAPIMFTKGALTEYNRSNYQFTDSILSDRSLGFTTEPQHRALTTTTTRTDTRVNPLSTFPEHGMLLNSTSLQFESAPVSVSTPESHSEPTHQNTRSFAFCTQMSYEQKMQLWRRKEADKAHRQQRYRYIYEPPLDTPMIDRVATTAILTPEVLSNQEADTHTEKRTASLFHFPASSVKFKHSRSVDSKYT